ncbi:MAG: hypothetical protein ACYDEZ_02005 [Methanoregula sp.]
MARIEQFLKQYSRSATRAIYQSGVLAFLSFIYGFNREGKRISDNERTTFENLADRYFYQGARSRTGSNRLSNVVNGYLDVKFKNQAKLIPGFVPRHLPGHISIHPSRNVVVELVGRSEKQLQKNGILKTDYHVGIEFHQTFQQKYQYKEKKVLEYLGVRTCVSIFHPVRLKKDEDDFKADKKYDTGRYRQVLDCKNWINGVNSHLIPT